MRWRCQRGPSRSASAPGSRPFPDDLGQDGHDALGLLAVEAVLLEPLHDAVLVKSRQRRRRRRRCGPRRQQEQRCRRGSHRGGRRRRCDQSARRRPGGQPRARAPHQQRHGSAHRPSVGPAMRGGWPRPCVQRGYAVSSVPSSSLSSVVAWRLRVLASSSRVLRCRYQPLVVLVGHLLAGHLLAGHQCCGLWLSAPLSPSGIPWNGCGLLPRRA